MRLQGEGPFYGIFVMPPFEVREEGVPVARGQADITSLVIGPCNPDEVERLVAEVERDREIVGGFAVPNKYAEMARRLGTTAVLRVPDFSSSPRSEVEQLLP